MEDINHFDKLGYTVNVGDYVAYPQLNSLELGIVIKLNKKMIKIQKVSQKQPKQRWRSPTPSVNKYSNDCIIIDSQLATLYILKNA